MSISFWQQTRRSRKLSYDVVVVGGGIVGTSTAYWLRRRQPSLRVALVEAHALGAGASGRSAGIVGQGTAADYLTDIDRYGERTARRLWHFTRANRDLMASELTGEAVGWSSNGSLAVAGDETEAERLQASVGRLRAAGAPVIYLNSEKTNARVRASGLHGGLYVTTGAVVNPLQLVRHLAETSEADLHTHLPVQQVHWDNEEGVLLDTPDLRLWGRRVVFALGASLPRLVPSVSGYVRSVRGQMLATTAAQSQSMPVPVYSHRDGFYVRQLETGEVMVGGGRHLHPEAEETDDDATTPAVQSSLERYLHTYYPWTRGLAIRARWSGTMGFSPDGRPVVGTVPEHPEGIFATGFTGRGMGYGFRMGRLLAKRACGAKHPDGYDLFTPDRFDNVDGQKGSRTIQPGESRRA